MRIRALALWQPWATLMALADEVRYPDADAKRVETRSWGTSYRGPLAIHASARWQREIADAIYHDVAGPFVAIRRALVRAGFTKLADLPLGRIVCVVNLYDVQPTEKLVHMVTLTERAFGGYSPGRFGFLTRDAFALPEPIPAKGKQGFWWTEIPDDLVPEWARNQCTAPPVQTYLPAGEAGT